MKELSDTDLMVIQGMINNSSFSGKDLEKGASLKVKINDEIKERLSLKENETEE